MSAVEVTISGILYDRAARTQQSVVLIGEATLTGLGVGGGPIVPEPPVQPPGIWPSPGRPTHPIARPGRPVDPGYGVEGPIVPPMPEEPPPDGGDKPPPEEGGWGFVSEWSKWGYFPAEESAQPKRR